MERSAAIKNERDESTKLEHMPNKSLSKEIHDQNKR